VLLGYYFSKSLRFIRNRQKQTIYSVWRSSDKSHDYQPDQSVHFAELTLAQLQSALNGDGFFTVIVTASSTPIVGPVDETIMRTTFVTIVIVLALMSTGRCQDNDEALRKARAEGRAAAQTMGEIKAVFECAAIASDRVSAIGTYDLEWKAEYERLFAFGYNKAEAFLTPDWVTNNKKNDPLFAKLGVSADFLIGMMWVESIGAIDHGMVLKIAVLENMFRERNCHLIGR
jgi:hypothetical protein